MAGPRLVVQESIVLRNTFPFVLIITESIPRDFAARNEIDDLRWMVVRHQRIE